MRQLTAQNGTEHETVITTKDADSGLTAIIAIHNTQLGPAVGGCRMFPYAQEAHALRDALRLSQGMTYKSALAGLPFGGGKSVILGDPRRDKTPALLRAMGTFVDMLAGRYIIAEDSGTSPDDMRVIGETTRHVTGSNAQLREDPSPATAHGVFLGIKAGIRQVFDTESLAGRSVAIQGLGHVGYHLAKYLTNAGAKVYGSDINVENLTRAEKDLGITAVSPHEILFQPCDVLSPCAMGAVLDEISIAKLQTQVIAGAANNQLATNEDDERLRARNIVYCPDFAINAGGIVDIHHQNNNACSDTRAEAIEHIGHSVASILERARSQAVGTQKIAVAMAEEQLNACPQKNYSLQRAAAV
ncbi:MAG: Glu/Leu/Phe/Val dehydrogenase dimerization domain-containing protein [Luminiphilus sp.]|nr:Glu/Leu/Phe/Val dehydrogenase dimerization domain-containing protein [Luminiphilus sp.]